MRRAFLGPDLAFAKIDFKTTRAVLDLVPDTIPGRLMGELLSYRVPDVPYVIEGVASAQNRAFLTRHARDFVAGAYEGGLWVQGYGVPVPPPYDEAFHSLADLGLGYGFVPRWGTT